MNINIRKNIVKHFHSSNLKANQLKNMLNQWLPFLMNRIKIINISNDFSIIHVQLKYSFWNRNLYKSIWGGSIASAIDPFYSIMIKQMILLSYGIKTDSFSKAIQIKFMHKAKSNLLFKFSISKEEILNAKEQIVKYNKYQGWHNICGIDVDQKECVIGKIQVYLKKR